MINNQFDARELDHRVNWSKLAYEVPHHPAYKFYQHLYKIEQYDSYFIVLPKALYQTYKQLKNEALSNHINIKEAYMI